MTTRLVGTVHRPGSDLWWPSGAGDAVAVTAPGYISPLDAGEVTETFVPIPAGALTSDPSISGLGRFVPAKYEIWPHHAAKNGFK